MIPFYGLEPLTSSISRFGHCTRRRRTDEALLMSLPLNSTTLPLRSSLSKTAITSTSDDSTSNGALNASRDARQLVRLAQCPQCSYPLQEPVTLPCGNSLCRKCLPEPHLRPNISYPATANRLQGFICPYCRQDHAVGDCNVDVVLNKIMNIVRTEMNGYRNTIDASEVLLQLEEKDKWSVAGTRF